MERRKRTNFTKAFKEEAVRLLEQSGRPASEIARELGIRRNPLYKWQEQIRAKGDDSFPGRGRQNGESLQLRRLRRDNARLQEEVAILKKAAAYFARESEQGTRLFESTRRCFRSKGCVAHCGSREAATMAGEADR